MPPLQVRESAGRCRLSLGSYAYGDGSTLQEAADDLVGRLLSIALAFRSAGFSIPSELGQPDLRWLGLLHELGEIAAAGGDIRRRLFGADSDPPRLDSARANPHDPGP
jgi:hypothetical protein